MIGILYICTGKYNVFWKEFFISAEKYFLTNAEKTYFVFTDAEGIYQEDHIRVKKIAQKSLGWPYNTLMRFDIFSTIKPALEKCEYLFFVNANTQFVDFVQEEILPGAHNDGLMAVIHPYFYDKGSSEFSYERNEASKAFIPYGKGKYYFMGAFNGGLTAAYLKLIENLKENINNDLQNGIIAVWWDESHLNNYMLHRNPLALSPAYLYPEDYDLPFKPKLLILDKLKYGGHSFLRGNN